MENLKKFFLIILNISIYSSLLSDTDPITLLKDTSTSSDSSSQLLSNAFDGNIDTEFKSSNSVFSWIGLELPSSYIITKIGWAQKENIKSNYLLGIFEGSN